MDKILDFIKYRITPGFFKLQLYTKSVCLTWTEYLPRRLRSKKGNISDPKSKENI